MEIQDGESVAFLESFDSSNSVFAKHQNAKVDKGVQARDGVNAVVIEVQEDKSKNWIQVLNSCDKVVL